MNKKTKLMLAALCAAVSLSAAGTVLFASPLTAEAAVVVDGNGGISVDGVENEVVINFAEQSTTVAFGMAVGCSVRYTNDEYSGLRWMSVISKTGYEELVSKYDAVAMGTLVTKTDLAEENFTVEYIQANEVEFWFAPANNTLEESGYIRFNAVHYVEEADYATPFYARAYIALKSGEEVTYVYSDYEKANHSRTIQEVAIDAIGAHNSGAESKQISEAGLAELCKYAGVESADEIGAIVYNVDDEVKYAGYVKGVGKAELYAPAKDGATFWSWYDFDYNKITSIGAEATENYNLTGIWAYEVSGVATATQGGNVWTLDGATITLTHSIGESATVTVSENGAYAAVIPAGAYTVSANGYVSSSIYVEGATTAADVQFTYKLLDSDNDNGNDVTLASGAINLPSKTFTLEYNFNLTSATPSGANYDANVVWGFYSDLANWTNVGNFESIVWDNHDFHVWQRNGVAKSFELSAAQIVEQGGVRVRIICDNSMVSLYAKVGGVWYECVPAVSVSGYNDIWVDRWGKDADNSLIEDYTYLPYVVNAYDVSGTATAKSGVHAWEMANVALTLTNTADESKTYTATTDENGAYSFADVPMGNYALTAANHVGSVAVSVYGDVEAGASEFTYKLTDQATDNGSDVSVADTWINLPSKVFTLEYTFNLASATASGENYDANVVWCFYKDRSWGEGSNLANLESMLWGEILHIRQRDGASDYQIAITPAQLIEQGGVRVRLVCDGTNASIYVKDNGVWKEGAVNINVSEYNDIYVARWGNDGANSLVEDYVYYPYLMETYAISGTLTATSGKSEAWTLPENVKVTLTSAENVFTTTTDANGAYSLEIPAGTYTLTVDGFTGSKEIIVTDSAVTERNLQLVWTLIPFANTDGRVNFTTDGWDYPGDVNLIGDNWTIEFTITSSRTSLDTSGGTIDKTIGFYFSGRTGYNYVQCGLYDTTLYAKYLNTNGGNVHQQIFASGNENILNALANGFKVKFVLQDNVLHSYIMNGEWLELGTGLDATSLQTIGLVSWSTEYTIASHSFTVN